MAQPFQFKLGPLAAGSANGICTSQTPVTAGNLTFGGSLAVGTKATLDLPRRILLTTVSNETAKTFTITGTNRTGNPITEVITGVTNTTVYSSNDFATVTNVAVSAATAGAVTVGTNFAASSPWCSVNRHTTPVNLGVGVTVSGTITFSVEYTYEDLENPINGIFPALWTQSALAAKTTNTDAGATFVFPVSAIRLTQTTSATAASASLVVLQAGLGFGN